MTRRQFLAGLLMAMVAFVLLPLQRFCEWGERWFGKARMPFQGVNRPFFDPTLDIEARLRELIDAMSKRRAPVQYEIHPDDYAALLVEMRASA